MNMQVTPSGEDGKEDKIELEFPALQRYLNIVSVTLAAILERVENLSEPETTVYNIQLAAQEVCTNVVRHAYANMPNQRMKIVITLPHNSPELILDVFDQGQSFEPDNIPQPNFDVGQAGGWGLFLMNELMDDVSYTRHENEGYNQWRLTKKLVTH